MLEFAVLAGFEQLQIVRERTPQPAMRRPRPQAPTRKPDDDLRPFWSTPAISSRASDAANFGWAAERSNRSPQTKAPTIMIVERAADLIRGVASAGIRMQ
jgi:hypothetical protein